MSNEYDKTETTPAVGGQNELLVMRNSNVDDELELIIEQQAKRIKELEEVVNAVAHIGVDWGCGEYVMLPTDSMVGKARKLLGA